MQQCDQLKQYCVISTLTLFIVIAASRPVNKNVSTGAVIRAKRGTDRAVRSSTRFFAVRFLDKRYILQQRCLKGQIRTCLLQFRALPSADYIQIQIHIWQLAGCDLIA